jgi:hypothetical protein
MTNPHDAQALALAKLQDLIAAIREATAALRPATPPPDRPDTVEARIIAAVRDHGRISFGDLGRALAEPKQRIHHHTHAVAMRRSAPVVIVKRPAPDGSRDYVLVAYDARWFPAELDSIGPWGGDPPTPRTGRGVADTDDTPIPSAP